MRTRSLCFDFRPWRDARGYANLRNIAQLGNAFVRITKGATTLEPKKLGIRLGNWLTAEQATGLWQAFDSYLL